jgi:ribose/xylose/arabinose/galactoside ABC-type transport system permease subunit
MMTTTTLDLPRRWRLPGWGLCLTVALVAELTFFTLTTRHFAGGGTGMLALSEQFAPTGVLSLGLAMVILTGSIDLSVAANASLAAVVAGIALDHGTGTAVAVLFAIAAGAVVGLFNGFAIAVLGIDSLLVTLATQFIVTSIATSAAGQSPPGTLKPFATSFQWLGQGTIGDVPVALLIFLVLALGAIAAVNYTTFGRSIVLMGYNRRAAAYTGISGRGTLISVFTLSGSLAGVAGVLFAAYYNSAVPENAAVLLLPAITAVVLGGVDIFGGRGRIGEVIVAVLLLGYLSQGMLLAGDSSLAVTMVTGLVLIGALVLKISLERNFRELWTIRIRQLQPPFAQRERPG